MIGSVVGVCTAFMYLAHWISIFLRFLRKSVPKIFYAFLRFLKSANRMQLGCPYTLVVGWLLVFAYILRILWNALNMVRRENKKLNPDAD
jgi:hypothetical protein